MTIPELLAAMTILAFIVSGILAVYVGGLRATDNMNQRFQAQQSARLALTSLRNEVSSACTESVAAGGASVTLTVPDGSGNGCTATNQVTWCAASAGGVAPFGLYRQSGATCTSSTGVFKAGSLTTSAVFTALTVSGQRPQLQVVFPVYANLSAKAGAYTLKDAITLLNAAVT